jgi:aspartate aminotransferase
VEEQMSIAIKVAAALERSSWIRRMFEEGAELRARFGAENVFDFTLGNPDIEPPEALHEKLRKLASAPPPGMHRYMNNAGYEETRAAVAARLSKGAPESLSANHVIMTCGAGGALNVVLKTILNPADEVIILAPFFVEYKFYIDNHGGVPVEVWTDKETFQPDLALLEEAITPNTRAVILNSPNNPTGVIYPESTLQQIGELLERKGKELDRTLYVISDEPYSRIAFDGVTVPNIFSCIRNSVVVTSHSKDLALPGERIGFLAASPQMEGIDPFMDGAVFCNRVLGFVNAPALAQRLVTELQDESVDASLTSASATPFTTISAHSGSRWSSRRAPSTSSPKHLPVTTSPSPSSARSTTSSSCPAAVSARPVISASPTA